MIKRPHAQPAVRTLRVGIAVGVAAWAVAVAATASSTGGIGTVGVDVAWTVPFVALLLPAWMRPGVVLAWIAAAATGMLAVLWVLPVAGLPIVFVAAVMITWSGARQRLR